MRKISQGFANAIKEVNLQTDKLQAISFRIWNSLNFSSLSETQLQRLKKLDSAKDIPVKMLKAKINLLNAIDFDPKTKYWIFIGGGSGSGLLLLVIVCLCIYCQCTKHSKRKARSTSLHKSNPDPENLNMMHTRVGAISLKIFQTLVRRLLESRDQKDLFESKIAKSNSESRVLKTP